MTLIRRAILAVALIPLLAPSVSFAAAHWSSVDSGAPDSVRFAKVAATATPGEVVIAVGTDVATNKAVIYRLVGDTWFADETSLEAADSSDLIDVAIDGTAGWAIGNAHTGGGGVVPKVVRLADIGVPGATTWRDVTLPAASAWLPRTIAFAPAGGSGLIGADDGKLYRITDGASGGTLDPTPLAQTVQANGPVTSLALTGAATGFATATAGSPDTSARFFGLDSNGLAPQPGLDPAGADTSRCGADPVALAALGGMALAIDSGCWWDFSANTSTWQRHPADAAFADADVHLHDVSLAGTGETMVAAIAGHVGTDASGDPAGGFMWRREGTSSWSADRDVAGTHLNGVAALATEDIWAVGGDGDGHPAVRHFAPDPPPPPPDSGTGGDPGAPTGGDPGTTPPGPADTSTTPADPPRDPGDGGSTGQGGDNSQTAASSHEKKRTPSDLHIVIETTETDPNSANGKPLHTTSGAPSTHKPGAHKPGGPRRLLRNVSVKAVKKTLVIAFDLQAPAAVAIAASRKGKPVGATPMRNFRAGHCKIILKYTGARPPTNLRIIAKRSAKTGSTGRPTAGKN